MSIEKKIEDLIDSINKNTAALIALAGSPVADAKAAAKPAAAKPAKTEAQKVAERVKATEAAAEDAEPAPTKEAVGLAVEAMLKANLKAQAVELLGKHGAKSASGVVAQGVEVMAAFIEDAKELLALAA